MFHSSKLEVAVKTCSSSKAVNYNSLEVKHHLFVVIMYPVVWALVPDSASPSRKCSNAVFGHYCLQF